MRLFKRGPTPADRARRHGEDHPPPNSWTSSSLRWCARCLKWISTSQVYEPGAPGTDSGFNAWNDVHLHHAEYNPAPDPIEDRVARVARARQMKADRDAAVQKARQQKDQRAAERRRKYEAGILGCCPACYNDAPVADGIILEHRKDAGEGDFEDCKKGPGEAPLPVWQMPTGRRLD
jgi:hypothetical protein